MKRVILASTLLMVASVSKAAVEFPVACKGIAAVSEQWTINEGKASLYFINNTSEHDVWLTHTQKEPAASAGWASELASGKWSAIQMDRNGFAFDCTESRPGHEQRVACQDVIAVCKQQATLNAKEKGSFWVAENLPLKQLQSSVQRRGIDLP